MQRDFGIAMCVKAVAERFQLPPQLRMIVDFAIEDRDCIPIVAAQGLVAAAEVDNFETDCAERNIARLERALLVRPAMGQRCRDPPDDTTVNSPIPMSKARNSTQGEKSPFFCSGVLTYIAQFKRHL